MLIAPFFSEDYIQQTLSSDDRTSYQIYSPPSKGSNNPLKPISINNNLSYTKEMIDVFFIHCNVTYEPLAKTLTGFIPFLIYYYEYSPYTTLVAQSGNHSIGWPRPDFTIINRDTFGFEPWRVESSLFIDKSSADHCCNALNECVVNIKFQRTRPEFKEKYKQFTREAKRAVEVLKEYLKKNS